MSEAWEQTTANPRRAYRDGRAAGRAEVAVILQDLIAQVREGHPTFGDEPPLWVKTALYAAENRLRKLTRDD